MPSGRPVAGLVLLAGAVAGVSLRLCLAWGAYGNYDQASWQIVAEIFHRGGNVYAETARYNYSPVWSFILGSLHSLQLLSGLPFHFLVRGFLTLIDVGNAVVLGLLGLQAGRRAGEAGLIYIVSPVAILIVGYHGQFDNVAALPLLLAAWMLGRSPEPPRLGAIWALATLGLCIKHLQVFSVWMLLVYAAGSLLRAAGLMAASLGVFAALFLPYVEGGLDGIVRNVLRYSGVPNPYGLTTVLPRGLVYVFFVLALSALPVLARTVLRLRLTRALELSAVALMVLIPASGEAYFIVPAVWGSVHASAGYWVFTAVASFFLLTGPNTFPALPISPPWNAVWLSLVLWLGLLIASALRDRRVPPAPPP